MKHKFLFGLSLIPLLLTSCSNNGIAGKYGFQMGKEKGTHFGVFVTLTNENKEVQIDSEHVNTYKKCEFSFSVSNGDDSESMASLLSLIASILNQEGDTITIPGYYYKGDKKLKDGEQEIKIGIDSSFIKDVMDDEDTPTSDVDFPVLGPDTLEKVIYTTYARETLTMYIPVGEVDAIYQLYWYGIDLQYSEEAGLHIGDSPYGKHDPGTHPTKEDVEEINKTFGTDHSEVASKIGMDLSTYRDYYTLAMGLLKQ